MLEAQSVRHNLPETKEYSPFYCLAEEWNDEGDILTIK